MDVPQSQKLVLDGPQKLVHHVALDREREETQITRQRHLKDFPALPDGKNVEPLGAGPVVPELPKDSANPPGNEEAREGRSLTLFQISQQRPPFPPVIQRVKQQR